MPSTIIRSFFCVLLLTLTHAAVTQELTPEQLQWLESDTPEPPEFQVNEGELVFLSSPPAKPIPHSENFFVIHATSLDDGWISLKQCHHRLDAVPELEVVYRYKQLRNLRIVSQHNIGQTEVFGNSVQMTDIRHDNQLCIEADIRVFYSNDGQHYQLINGPYHRQFLDGFYPYHVSLHITYPDKALEFIQTNPPPQPGFTVDYQSDQIDINAWFEGRLMTAVQFRKKLP